MRSENDATIDIHAQDIVPISASLPKHILSLTSTRFIASFAIVIYHFKDKIPSINIDDYTFILKNAYLGVDFFFILSGFIMAHSYAARIKTHKFSFSDFIKRRFARIYPVHLVMTLIFAVLGLVFFTLGIRPNVPEKYDLIALPINLLLLQAWGLTTEGTLNTPSWSISAEWVAYMLFFPFMLFLMRFKAVIAFLIGLICLFLFYYATPVVLGRLLTDLDHYFGVVRILPEFFFGIAVYLLLGKSIPSQNLSTVLWYGSILAILICLHLSAPDLLIILLFGLSIYALAARSCYGQNHILDNPMFVYGGEISYSMYMTHSLIYTLAFNGADFLVKDMRVWSQSGILIVAICAVIPSAMLCFHLIEEPGRKFINNGFRFSPIQKNAVSH